MIYTLTIEEFQKTGVATNSTLEAAISLQKEVSKFYPCNVDVIVNETEEGLFLHNAHVVLGSGVIVFMFRDKYHFCIHPEKEKILRKKVQQYLFQETRNKYPIPNDVGVLTVNKIRKWVEYWTLVNGDLEAEANKHEKNVDAFWEEVKRVVKGGAVWNAWSQTQGTVKKDQLELQYEIQPGYIFQKVTYEGSSLIKNLWK